jgi:autotransporter-associated beta strand protein
MSDGFQIYQLIFGSGSTSNRTLNGNRVTFNPNWNILGNTVKIENYSSASHTVNLAISRSNGTGDLQLNPVSGNLIFGGTIDNGGMDINIWGDNFKVLELNNTISGSGSLRVRRSTIVKLNAANSYTGSTVVHQGELWIMSNGSISSSSPIWIGDGCCPTNTTKLFLADGDGGQNFSNGINFNYGNSGNQVLGGLNTSGTNTFSSNNISVSAGNTLTIEEVSSGGTLEFSNGISGSGSIRLVGSGTSIFSGANTYSGVTTVAGGTLRLNRSGGSTLPATNNVSVTGGELRISTDQALNDLSIANGTTLTIDANATLTINGSFTGGGTIVNNGTLILKGNSSFPGSNTSLSAMNNLTIDRSGGITLDKSITVSGILTLTAGKLSLGTHDLTLGASASVSGANSSKYISTTGTGVVKKNIDHTISFTFPTGNTTYNPVILTNKGTSDEFSIRVEDQVLIGGTSGAAVTDNVVNRTWHIGKSNPNTNAGVDFTFQWESNQELGNITGHTLSHYNTFWASAAGSSGSVVINGTTHTMTHTGYTGGFSPFAIGGTGSTLPVSWLSFSAAKFQNHVALNWSTASEQNTKEFDVQHSMDTREWTSLGRVAAAGNSTATRTYEFKHENPLKGNPFHYYRIKQNDLDGKYTYSKVIRIDYAEALANIVVYPNPVSDMLHVNLTERQEIRLVNMQGVVVWKGVLPAGRHDIQVSKFSSGTYMLQTSKGTYKVMKQ